MLKRVAVKLSKICNDLRLLSSGPRAGLGEINLPPMQPGSSIMPGKVNPVIPEVVNQVCFQVVGNDLTVTMAAEAGQLAAERVRAGHRVQPLPVGGHADAACVVLRERCVLGITANREWIRHMLERSIGIVTALVPYIGYERASAVAREALETDRGVYELVLEKGWLTQEELDDILSPEAMTKPRAMPVLRGRFDAQDEAPPKAAGPRRRSVNVEPWPGSLSTGCRRRAGAASCSDNASPSPVPPYSRVDEPSTWRNSSKTPDSASAAMPMPVSRTIHSTDSTVPCRRARTLTTISPWLVNLIALLSRLSRIFRTFSTSVSTGTRLSPSMRTRTRDEGCGARFSARRTSSTASVISGITSARPSFSSVSVEQVVDQVQQHGRGSVDLRERGTLIRRNRAGLPFTHEIRVAEHTRERCPELVAHVGEELVLEPLRSFTARDPPLQFRNALVQLRVLFTKVLRRRCVVRRA